jgi:hypothetical protein
MVTDIALVTKWQHNNLCGRWHAEACVARQSHTSYVITLHALWHLGCHADFGNGVMDLQASGGGLSGVGSAIYFLSPSF